MFRGTPHSFGQASLPTTISPAFTMWWTFRSLTTARVSSQRPARVGRPWKTSGHRDTWVDDMVTRLARCFFVRQEPLPASYWSLAQGAVLFLRWGEVSPSPQSARIARGNCSVFFNRGGGRYHPIDMASELSVITDRC